MLRKTKRIVGFLIMIVLGSACFAQGLLCGYDWVTWNYEMKLVYLRGVQDGAYYAMGAIQGEFKTPVDMSMLYRYAVNEMETIDIMIGKLDIMYMNPGNRYIPITTAFLMYPVVFDNVMRQTYKTYNGKP